MSERGKGGSLAGVTDVLLVSKSRGARVSARPHLSPSSDTAATVWVRAADRTVPPGQQAGPAREEGGCSHPAPQQTAGTFYRSSLEPSIPCGCDAETDRREPSLWGAGLPGLRSTPHGPVHPHQPCPHTKLCMVQQPSAFPWLEPGSSLCCCRSFLELPTPAEPAAGCRCLRLFSPGMNGGAVIWHPLYAAAEFTTGK